MFHLLTFAHLLLHFSGLGRGKRLSNDIWEGYKWMLAISSEDVLWLWVRTISILELTHIDFVCLHIGLICSDTGLVHLHTSFICSYTIHLLISTFASNISCIHCAWKSTKLLISIRTPPSAITPKEPSLSLHSHPRNRLQPWNLCLHPLH